MIGEGSQGRVFRAKSMSSQPVIIKIFHNSRVPFFSEQKWGKVPGEISILKTLTRELRGTKETPIAPKYIDHRRSGDHHIPIMEDLGADWVDLFTFIGLYHGEDGYSMPKETAQLVYIYIMIAVKKLRSAGYYHNDLKSKYCLI